MKKLNSFLWYGSYGNTVYMSYNISDNKFLIVKMILMIYLMFCFVLNQYNYFGQGYFLQFVYLTIWGFYTTFTYFLLSLIYGFYVYLKKKNDQQFEPSFNFLPKLINILFEIAFSIELTITVLFWALVFPTKSLGAWQLFNTSNFHGGMLIALWIDNMFNCIQFRKSHLLPFVVYAISYSCVNFTYVLTANKEIYPGLNWVTLYSYIELLLGAVSTMIHYFIGFYLFKKVKKQYLSQRVEKKCLVTSSEDNDNECTLQNNLTKKTPFLESKNKESIDSQNYV
ncbi:transmembrane protein, putative (macronuclear) [Tetrahymena thermophila SB210]|uniref:Transmembrane protein, putative n=1 Tax=Tetrahymena thermophila (strain SB210) TaxID=312017 RepID=Q23KE3_TETTS|nr:transmembrane protein, putative [Tetrahymena thermophila SB210]EAR96900.1 transmembrane protein, putative [Tetrahymena thermophila SB210]|eukprot:XP_001017145.1 transmembrane protein, putative [Tetrahymena thermophila SB210]